MTSFGSVGELNVDALVGAFGAPAVSAGMSKLIALGMSRAIELNTTGFTTSGLYNVDNLQLAQRAQAGVSVRSEGTKTRYVFAIPQDAVVTEDSVDVILVVIGDEDVPLQPTNMTRHRLVPFMGPMGRQIKVMPGRA